MEPTLEPTSLPPPPCAIPAMPGVSEKQTRQELEAENTRLHQLVADLLVRNQQLRLELKARTL